MKQKIISAIIFGCIVSIFILNCNFAHAAALTSLSDTLTRLKKSTAANHTISFVTPSGIDVGDTVTFTFASDFDVSAVVVADVTIGGNQPASATVLGQVITITADADTTVAPAGTAAIVIGNSHITNATTAGSFTVSIGGTFGDTGSYAIAVADDDQVASSGTVDPTLNFNVTDGTVAFGTLSATAVKTDTATMTAATNSSSGYSITVNGNTLTSGANTITAIGAVATASAPGTKQYGFKISAAGGSGAAVAPYNTADYAFDIDNVPDQVATSAGVSTTTTFTITYIANISDITLPGTYTATHTYICTGNF